MAVVSVVKGVGGDLRGRLGHIEGLLLGSVRAVEETRGNKKEHTRGRTGY